MPEDRGSDAREWPWLSRELIEALHAESVYRFGGTTGLRSEDLLESALAVPRQLHLDPDEAQTVTMIRSVAAGDTEREALARWLEANSRPVEP